MKTSTITCACLFLSGLLLASGTFCTLAATGTIQGKLTAGQIGNTAAAESMVEALDATDATVVQTAVVNDDNSFALILPPGAYRICFRFTAYAEADPSNYHDERSFYVEAQNQPAISCFAAGTVVTVAEGTTTLINPFVGYRLDPMVVVTPMSIAGTVAAGVGQPLQNIRVDLLDDCSANVVRTTSSAVDGTFLFQSAYGLPYAPWKIRFLDPSGRYATSFYGADDFIGATPMTSYTDVLKELVLRPHDIEVSPLSHDFGDVALPESVTAIVTIGNRGGSTLQVSSINLLSGASPYISIQSTPALPVTLEAGASSEVTLLFEPHALGPAAATLEVVSDDPDKSTVLVTLNGAAVASEAPPAEQVATTLEFIQDAATEGTLQGTGPAGAADAHLQALLNQIKAASDLAAAGKLMQACQQLANAVQRTDGEPQPPDFVSGPAALELKLLIELTRQAIGCR